MSANPPFQSHVSEPFWSINLVYREQQNPQLQHQQHPPQGGGVAGGPPCEFTWARGRLFDHDVAELIFEVIMWGMDKEMILLDPDVAHLGPT